MVLVCYEHNFIFTKTIKTAGTSVEFALEPFCRPDSAKAEEGQALVTEKGIIGARGPSVAARVEKIDGKWPWWNHMPASQILDNLGAERFWAAHRISCLRNPFDRLVSQYHFRAQKADGHIEDTVEMISDFRSFVKSLNWSDSRGQLRIGDRIAIDHLIHAETVQQDLDRVADRIGLDKARIELPHLKPNPHKHKHLPVPDYFDAETIGIVRKRMDWYFEAFGYPTEPRPKGENRAQAA